MSLRDHSGRALALALLVLSWPWIGLFGHEPWKPDEAYSFGIVLSFLQGQNPVIPALAGSPFMEKPPLLYWTAAATASLFRGALSLPDAARVSIGLFMSATLAFIAAAAAEWFGRPRAFVAPLMFIAAIGVFDKVHLLVTDVGLVCGFSIATYGLALAPRRPALGGLALGLGAAVGFMCKGLLAPGVLVLTGIAVLLNRAHRTPGMLRAMVLALAIGTPLMLAWPALLYAQSEPLFREWLVLNNFGRYFGFVRLGHRRDKWFYPVTLLWFAFPTWLPAAASLITAMRSRSLATPIFVPATLFVAMLAVLMSATDARTLYALPLVVPLSLMAVPALDTMANTLVQPAARIATSLCIAVALALWLGWLVVVTGWPQAASTAIVERFAGFVMPVVPFALVVAVAATALALAALSLRTPTPSSPLLNWVAGSTLCWTLVATLWLPAVDHIKSYRDEIRALAAALPADAHCVAGSQLGEPVRAMLHYYIGLITRNVDNDTSTRAECDYLLVQVEHQRPVPDWIAFKRLPLVWRGSRPGDTREALELYRLPNTALP